MDADYRKSLEKYLESLKQTMELDELVAKEINSDIEFIANKIDFHKKEITHLQKQLATNYEQITIGKKLIEKTEQELKED